MSKNCRYCKRRLGINGYRYLEAHEKQCTKNPERIMAGKTRACAGTRNHVPIPRLHLGVS